MDSINNRFLIMKKNRWEEFLDKCNKQPLIGFLWEPDVVPASSVIEKVGIGNELLPEKIEIRDLIEHANMVRNNLQLWESESDFMQAISVNMGIPWIEAIIGCKLILQKDSIWAKPPENNELSQIDITENNPWLQRLIELHNGLIKFADGKFPVCLPVMHGTLDVISAFRNPEVLCLDLYDNPDILKNVIRKIDKLWISIAKKLMDITPPFYGGWFSRMNIYLKHRCATPQCDFSSLISMKMYQKFGLESDKKIISFLPSQTYHSHNTSYHILEIISKLDNLFSLQITIDKNGPSNDKMKLIIEKCKKNIPVLISVWNEKDFEWFARNLTPNGLGIVLIKKQLDKRELFYQLKKWVVLNN
jgi:hypothetical protein